MLLETFDFPTSRHLHMSLEVAEREMCGQGTTLVGQE